MDEDQIHFIFVERMTKEDYIRYWITTADDSCDTMEYLFKAKKYMDALFFGHLYIEKLCKALWVKNNEANTPPRIHNLVKLLAQAKVKVDEEKLLFLDMLLQYQLEGRYPDYKLRLHQQTTDIKANDFLKDIKSIAEWLKEQI